MHAIAVIRLNLNPPSKNPRSATEWLHANIRLDTATRGLVQACWVCLLTCLLTVAGHCPAIDVLSLILAIFTYVLCVACNFTYIRWSVMNSLTASIGPSLWLV